MGFLSPFSPLPTAEWEMGSCGSIHGVKAEVLLQDAGEYLEVKTLVCTEILGATDPKLPRTHRIWGQPSDFPWQECWSLQVFPFSWLFFFPSASRKAVTYLLF